MLGQLATDIVPRKRWAPLVLKWGREGRPGYVEARATLRLPTKRAKKLGFVDTSPTYRWNAELGRSEIIAGADTAVSYGALTKAWRKIVRARMRSR